MTKKKLILTIRRIIKNYGKYRKEYEKTGFLGIEPSGEGYELFTHNLVPCPYCLLPSAIYHSLIDAQDGCLLFRNISPGDLFSIDSAEYSDYLYLSVMLMTFNMVGGNLGFYNKNSLVTFKTGEWLKVLNMQRNHITHPVFLKEADRIITSATKLSARHPY